MKSVVSTVFLILAGLFLFTACNKGPDVAGKSYTAPKALLGTDITYSFTDKEYTLEAMNMILEEGTYRTDGDAVFIKANGAGSKEEILNYREDKLIDKEGLVLENAVTLKTAAVKSMIKNSSAREN